MEKNKIKLPKFNNIENEHLILQVHNGRNSFKRNIWVSRAPAVVGLIFAFGVDNDVRVLIIKRSKNMLDEPLKFGAPSGYLDWNESGYEGITREVYEETSMYLPHFEQFLKFNNNEQPFYVQTDPDKDKHQNVSLSYVLAYDFSGHEEFFPSEIKNYTDRETAEVQWLKLSDFYNIKKEWAFNHNRRIESAFNFLKTQNI